MASALVLHLKSGVTCSGLFFPCPGDVGLFSATDSGWKATLNCVQFHCNHRSCQPKISDEMKKRFGLDLAVENEFHRIRWILSPRAPSPKEVWQGFSFSHKHRSLVQRQSEQQEHAYNQPSSSSCEHLQLGHELVKFS